MKNIYIVQAGCSYGNTYYLPYAAGMLVAFAFDDKRIASSYKFKRIIYSFEDIDTAIETFEQPFLVGFSNSIWNYKYNLEFAKKLKRRHPKCIIEFGGHHIPPDVSWLEMYNFIDVLCHGKSEESFRDLLLALNSNKELSNVSNISYRDTHGVTHKTFTKKSTLSNYPSPYLNGIFDDIIKTKEHSFSCVLETNRGCPYECSYCDWGELSSQVRLFEINKVFSELEWMAINKIEFVYCIDANFGMFERDEQIAQRIVELKNKYGYPKRLQVSYAKDKPDRVLRINKMLSENDIGKGATLSLQSLSPTVLKNIGRINISKQEFSRQLSLYREAHIPTYTELILGLPGETIESFSRGLCELLELGQHSSVSVYYCELLPNALMSSEDYKKKHRIVTVSTSLNQYHCEVMDDKLSGASNIVVETETLSKNEWVDANVFSTLVQSFHHFGLLQCVAMYCRHELNISYFDFYSSLWIYINNETVFLKSVFDEISNILTGFVDGRCGLVWQNSIFGEITYPVEEAVFLICNYNQKVFYNEINKFIIKYFSDSIMLEQLLLYQKRIMLVPNISDFTMSFSYDFFDYFEKILSGKYMPLTKCKVSYRFTTPFKTSNWSDYAKTIVWFGRRNGRMLFSSNPNKVSKINESEG